MEETHAMDRLSRDEREHADALLARAHCGDAAAERAAMAELAEWERGHPARTGYVRSLDAASNLMERAAPGLRERYPRRPPGLGRSRRGFRDIALHAAVACSVAAAIAVLLWWNNPVLEGRMLQSAAGAQRTLTLGDGSRITLNSRSRVGVQLRLRSREVVLEEGEALFEVSKSAWRPWTTRAGDARISVLGTVFNVRRDGESVRLTVFEGCVSFDPGSGLDIVVVDAGRAAESRRGSLVSAPVAANLPAVRAWRERRMVFEDTPLAVAMAEAGRYRDAAIRVDSQVASLRITGAFPTTDPERLLRLLPDAVPVVVVRAADGSVDIRPREPEPAGPWQPPAAANRRP